MFRMRRGFPVVLGLLMFVSAGRPGMARPADQPAEMLARAEALYYEADFAKSVELLLRADEMLSQQAENMQQKTAIKLQLALGYMGLNDNAQAKSYLEQLYALDADYRVDPQVYSPKVTRLADEAKTDQNQRRCQSLFDEAQRQLGTGNAESVANLVGSNAAKCSGLATLNSKIADLFYKEGLDAYKKARTEEALQKFRTALRLEPNHELAAQYLDLAQSKLEVAADRVLLAWRKDFTAGDYAAAARDYRDLLPRSNAETIEQIRQEYRQNLSNLADAWTKACANDDASVMDDLRMRANALLPEASMGQDILDKMKTCVHTRCIQATTQLALARLKNRIDPQFSPYVVSIIKEPQVTVRVKATIDATGNVAASQLDGGNPLVYDAVRTAVDQWKFYPAVVQGEPRCVETEIPFVLKFVQH